MDLKTCTLYLGAVTYLRQFCQMQQKIGASRLEEINAMRTIKAIVGDPGFNKLNDIDDMLEWFQLKLNESYGKM